MHDDGAHGTFHGGGHAIERGRMPNGRTRLYSVGEVAAILGKSPDTIRRWCEAGVFPHARRIMGRWQIPAWDVEPFLPPPAPPWWPEEPEEPEEDPEEPEEPPTAP